MDREEAIKIIREYYPSSGKDLNEALETLIPELKESEDEEMIEIIRGAIFTATMDEATRRDALAWLEKQGEKNDF